MVSVSMYRVGFATLCVAAAIGAVAVTVATHRTESALVGRVIGYRNAGAEDDGVHVIFQPIRITAEDYALMGADNSCAQIKAARLGVTDESRFLTSRWFNVDPKGGLEHDRRRFWNAHYTNGILEAALMMVPLPDYQVSPEEVVWHHLRVAALKAKGVQQPERIAIMARERASTPWVSR